MLTCTFLAHFHGGHTGTQRMRIYDPICRRRQRRNLLMRSRRCRLLSRQPTGVVRVVRVDLVASPHLRERPRAPRVGGVCSCFVLIIVLVDAIHRRRARVRTFEFGCCEPIDVSKRKAKVRRLNGSRCVAIQYAIPLKRALLLIFSAYYIGKRELQPECDDNCRTMFSPYFLPAWLNLS